MPDDLVVDVLAGWIDPELAAAFPGLELRLAEVARGSSPTPPGLRGALLDHSTRFRGEQALEFPLHHHPRAYRDFAVGAGADPDADVTPMEEIRRDRLIRGRFRRRGRVADAVTIAILETHVALGAADPDRLDGPLGLRRVNGTPVLADSQGPVGPLYGPVDEHFRVGADSRRTLLYAIGVPGVGRYDLDEALWRAADLMSE